MVRPRIQPHTCWSSGTENQLVKELGWLIFDIAPEAVIESLDVEHFVPKPATSCKRKDQIVCDHLKLDVPAADMNGLRWSTVMNLKKQVKILAGKYVELQDAYISVGGSKHSGYANDEKTYHWVNANDGSWYGRTFERRGWDHCPRWLLVNVGNRRKN